MERQLKLVFKRDNRRTAKDFLTFVYSEYNKINPEKLGIENKLFKNKDGWYDCDGEIISDDLDIFEKEEGKLDFGDYMYYWTTPQNLDFEEFEYYLTDADENFSEILEGIGVPDDVINFLKLKDKDLRFWDFKNLLEKISEELFYKSGLIEILEVLEEI